MTQGRVGGQQADKATVSQMVTDGRSRRHHSVSLVNFFFSSLCAILLRLCGNDVVSLCQVVVSTTGVTRRPFAPGLEFSRWDALPMQMWSRMG